MIRSCVAFYPCKSIEQTHEFYTRIIGLRLAFSGPTSRIYSCREGYFGFVEYPDGKTAVGRICLSLNCGSQQEVDEEYRRIVGLVREPLGKPALHASQPVYSFFVKDPNGYLVEFQKISGASL